MRIQITLQEIVLVTAGDFDTEWHGIEIICDDQIRCQLVPSELIVHSWLITKLPLRVLE